MRARRGERGGRGGRTAAAERLRRARSPERECTSARSRWRLAAATAQGRAPLRGETPAGGRRHCSGARPKQGEGAPHAGRGRGTRREGTPPEEPRTRLEGLRSQENVSQGTLGKRVSPRGMGAAHKPGQEGASCSVEGAGLPKKDKDQQEGTLGRSPKRSGLQSFLGFPQPGSFRLN